MPKSNISIWDNPRKIGISCFGTESIVQVLSGFNQVVVVIDRHDEFQEESYTVYIKYGY